MVGGKLVSPTDEDVVAAAGHLHHVVGNQAVAPFDEIEDAFTLSDSRAAHEEQAYSINIGQRAMQCGAGCKGFLDDGLDPAIELRCLQLAAENRDSLRTAQL